MGLFSRLAVQGVEKISSPRPLNLAFASFAGSMALLLLCAPAAGVWSYQNSSGQETGYAQAINWSIGFTLMTPIFAFFLLRSFRELEDLPGRLAGRGMILDSGYSTHPRASQLISARWATMRRTYAPWWLGISLLGLAESIGEWAATSMLPLVGIRTPAEGEFDWSVAHLDGTTIEKVFNGGFSFLVFLQQAWLISLIGFMIFFVLALSALMHDLRRQDRAGRLFPSLDGCGKDARLGFEGFAPLFQFFLLSNLFLYAHFFLSRVWNAYLHPGQDEIRRQSVWGLIRGPLLSGGESQIQGLGAGQISNAILLYFQKLGAFNFSGIAVSLGALIVLLLSIALLVVTMRRTASDGRDELLDAGLSRTKQTCLTEMAIWPLRYPGINTLFGLAVLGAVCMVAYRLGIWFLGMLLVASCIWGFSQVSRSSD